MLSHFYFDNTMSSYLYSILLVLFCLSTGNVLGLNTTYSASVSGSKQPRQYSTSYSSYASPLANMNTSPIEAIVVGVLAVCGLSLFGIPLLLMLMNLFSLNSNPGVSVIPTATTSVNAGRRKRSATNLLDQHLFSQMVDSLNTFLQSEQKMQLLQRLIS